MAAFDCLILDAIGGVLVMSMLLETAVFLDAVLIVTLLGFLGTVSLAMYLESKARNATGAQSRRGSGNDADQRRSTRQAADAGQAPANSGDAASSDGAFSRDAGTKPTAWK